MSPNIISLDRLLYPRGRAQLFTNSSRWVRTLKRTAPRKPTSRFYSPTLYSALASLRISSASVDRSNGAPLSRLFVNRFPRETTKISVIIFRYRDVRSIDLRLHGEASSQRRSWAESVMADNVVGRSEWSSISRPVPPMLRGALDTRPKRNQAPGTMSGLRCATESNRRPRVVEGSAWITRRPRIGIARLAPAGRIRHLPRNYDRKCGRRRVNPPNHRGCATRTDRRIRKFRQSRDGARHISRVTGNLPARAALIGRKSREASQHRPGVNRNINNGLNSLTVNCRFLIVNSVVLSVSPRWDLIRSRAVAWRPTSRERSALSSSARLFAPCRPTDTAVLINTGTSPTPDSEDPKDVRKSLGNG